MGGIPVIDLAPYFDGGAYGRHKVARVVGLACRDLACRDLACRDLGFLTVAGHGVPMGLVQAPHDDAHTFFAPDIRPGPVYSWSARRSGSTTRPRAWLDRHRTGDLRALAPLSLGMPHLREEPHEPPAHPFHPESRKAEP